MMAWMNEESLRLTFEEGRTVFWSRSRQEIWRKGDTSGEVQRIREAYYDCDGDALLFVVDQEGGGACHTGDALVLLPGLRRGDVTGLRMQPGRDEFRRAGRRAHRGAGVDGAARGPRDSGGGLRQAGRRSGRVPARIGRARGALEPVLVRRPVTDRHARPARRCGGARRCGPARRAHGPGDARRAGGATRRVPGPAAARPAAAAERRGRLSGLRRGPRGRAPARCAARRPEPARRGHERDRFAGRVRPLASAGLRDRERAGPRPGRSGRARCRVRPGGGAASRPPWPIWPVRCRTPPCRRPCPTNRCRRSARPCGTGATSRPSRWRRSTSRRATSSRSCCRSGTTSSSTPTRSTSTACCARSTPARTCTSSATPR